MFKSYMCYEPYMRSKDWTPKTFAIRSKDQTRPCLLVEAEYFGIDSRDLDRDKCAHCIALSIEFLLEPEKYKRL